MEFGEGTIDTLLGPRRFRVTGPSSLADSQTPEGQQRRIGIWAAEVWMRWAQGNEHEWEFPPTIEELQANMRGQARWVAAFSDPRI